MNRKTLVDSLVFDVFPDTTLSHQIQREILTIRIEEAITTVQHKQIIGTSYEAYLISRGLL